MSSHFLLQTDEISPPPPYPKGLELNPSTHYLKNDPRLDSTVELYFLREGLMELCHGHAESDVQQTKDKEVCTARVDESGESFRVPDGLATEQRGLRKYKLYRQACNTWNANDQSSRAKIVLWENVRTYVHVRVLALCSRTLLLTTYVSPFVLKSSFVIFLKSNHGAIGTTIT
jgi:hypothetical protein